MSKIKIIMSIIYLINIHRIAFADDPILISKAYNFIYAEACQIKEVIGDRSEFDVMFSSSSNKLIFIPKVEHLHVSLLNNDGELKNIEFSAKLTKPQVIKIDMKPGFNLIAKDVEFMFYEEVSKILKGYMHFEPYKKPEVIKRRDFHAVKKGFFINGFDLYSITAKKSIDIDRLIIDQLEPNAMEYYTQKKHLIPKESTQILIYDQ